MILKRSDAIVDMAIAGVMSPYDPRPRDESGRKPIMREISPAHYKDKVTGNMEQWEDFIDLLQEIFDDMPEYKGEDGYNPELRDKVQQFLRENGR